MSNRENMLLEEQVERFASIFPFKGIGIIIKNVAGEVVEWNEEAESIIGYTLEEVRGKTTEMFTYRYQDEMIANIQKTVAQGKVSLQKILDVKRKDGSKRTCSTFYLPIFGTDQKVIGSFVILRDVTEEELADKKVHDLAAIFSVADAGIVLRDAEGDIVDWNIGAYNILGYKKEEMIGKKAKSYAPLYSHQDLDEVDKRLMQGEHIAHVEIQRNHKDGYIVECSISYTPIFDNNGVYTGSIAIFHDISEKKMDEKKAQNLAAIFSVADAGIILKDTHGTILEWNVGARNILGYEPEEIIGRTTKIYAPVSGYFDIDEIEERVMKGEHIAHVEVVRKHKDGRLIHCSASYTPIINKRGNITGSIAIFHDITEKKQAEEKHRKAEMELQKALRKAAETAQEVSRTKTAFLANMSHEIRTPLNGVIGFAELALDDGQLSRKTREYLNMIQNSAGVLLEIINDVLDISKIEAGKVELEKTPFVLQEVIRYCKNISTQRAEEKGVELYFYSEPSIGRMLVGDPTKLRQILLNLLSNAIKFTDSGIVKMMSSVSAITENTITMYFEVRDSGIGMSEELVSRVFQPFIQADSSTTRKYGGTGLGLAITKNLVELMGGKLELESQPGEGSKFSFSITFDTVGMEEGTGVSGEVVEIGTMKPMFAGEVLVCEDNEINQIVIKEHLAKIGLKATIAPNGMAGVWEVSRRMSAGNPFDIIFMDIHMPVMDGLEAAEKLKEMGCDTPIIAMTANVMAKDKEHYLKHGMVDYIGKPFVAKTLWSCLLNYLTPIEIAATREITNRSLLQSDKAVIDKVLGVERSAGSEELYQRLKTNFLEKGKIIIKDINRALQNDNRKEAYRIVHSLKSNAGTIGAVKLQKAAEDLEQILKEGGQQVPEIQLQVFTDMLNEVLEALGVDSKEKQQLSEEESREEETAEGYGKEAIQTMLDELEPLLAAGNAQCLEMTAKLRKALRPLGGQGQKLIRDIEEYDFEQAYYCLKEIRQQMPAGED